MILVVTTCLVCMSVQGVTVRNCTHLSGSGGSERPCTIRTMASSMMGSPIVSLFFRTCNSLRALCLPVLPCAAPNVSMAAGQAAVEQQLNAGVCR